MSGAHVPSQPGAQAAPLRPAAYRFEVRVYWEDTDAGGVVFYANYLKFFERARTEWLRSLGFGQETLRVEQGVLFVVSDTAVRYLQPARLDDLLCVDVVLQQRGQASLVLDQQAWRVPAAPAAADAAPVLIARGSIRIGCVDAARLKPCRIPASLLERLA